MEKIRNQFSWKNLLPTQEDPMLFVVSQWQVNKTEPGFFYLLYRLIPATFFVTTWCIRLGAPNWTIYLSMWGYTLCTLDAVLGLLLSLSGILTIKVLKNTDLGRKFIKMYPLYWLINVTARTVGYLISTVHWSLLFKGKGFTAMDFFIHGVNCIYLTIDLLLAGHPVRILHMVYPLTFSGAYAVFGIIYHFYDKNRGGSGYVYPIMDWDYPASTALVVLGIVILIIFYHLLTFAIYLIKLHIYRKLYDKDNIHLKNMTEQET